MSWSENWGIIRKLENKAIAALTAGSRHITSVQIHAIKMDVPGTHRSRYQTLGPLLHCHRKTRVFASLLASGNSRSATSVLLLFSKYDIHMSASAETVPHVEMRKSEKWSLLLSVF